MTKSDLVYLFDADLKAVGQAIATVRPDAAVIGDDRSGIPDVKDEDWFPKAGQRQLIVIRRDKDVLTPGSAERRAWEKHRLRGFVLAITKPTMWDEFTVLVRAWDTLENHIRDHQAEFGWVAKIVRRANVQPA